MEAVQQQQPGLFKTFEWPASTAAVQTGEGICLINTDERDNPEVLTAACVRTYTHINSWNPLSAGMTQLFLPCDTITAPIPHPASLQARWAHKDTLKSSVLTRGGEGATIQTTPCTCHLPTLSQRPESSLSLLGAWSHRPLQHNQLSFTPATFIHKSGGSHLLSRQGKTQRDCKYFGLNIAFNWDYKETRLSAPHWRLADYVGTSKTILKPSAAVLIVSHPG